MSEFARTILRAVLDLGARQGVIASGGQIIGSTKWAAFEDAAEVAIDRLVDEGVDRIASMHAEALHNARADVAHFLRERDAARAEVARVSAGRDALAAEVLALTQNLIDASPGPDPNQSRLAYDDDGQ